MISGVFVKAIVWQSTKTWDIKNKKIFLNKQPHNYDVVHLVIVLTSLVKTITKLVILTSFNWFLQHDTHTYYLGVNWVCLKASSMPNCELQTGWGHPGCGLVTELLFLKMPFIALGNAIAIWGTYQ